METTTAHLVLMGLAHDTRLALFRLLVPIGPNGEPAGRLGRQLKLPPATLSFHLKELRLAGLIRQRRVGRVIYYAANYQAINDLIAYLTENCCQGAACLPAVAPIKKPSSRTRPRRVVRRG